MIRYVLVDDSQSTLEVVKSKIDTIAIDYELVHVASYNSSKKAYEALQHIDFDLLIVDYEMPVYNGIELAKKVAQSKKIIFLTSTVHNEQKMINALEISGYLSKPFDIEEFKSIIKHKIIGKLTPKAIHPNANLITITIGANKDVRFKTDDVYYISTSKNINGEQPIKNCVHIYGKDDALLFKNIRKSISDLSEELKLFNFEKINKTTLLNLQHLKERDNTNVELYHTTETFQITNKEKKGFVARVRSFFKA